MRDEASEAKSPAEPGPFDVIMNVLRFNRLFNHFADTK